jgi:hypothetical protein
MKLQCEKSSLGSEHIQANPRALIQSSLARFDKNKEKLLQTLIDERKRGAGKAIFDTTESWEILRRMAEFYLGFEHTRENASSNAQMAKDFTNLKRKLSDARALLMKGDVFFGLVRPIFHARYTQTPLAVLKADPLVASKILNELTETASHVRKLEMAASRAAANARGKPGRPNSGSTILPSDCIVGLARLYRDATGRVPGAGEGPFGFFLVEFLNAVGRPNLASRSVFNLIIPARKTSLATDPDSPFKRK